MKRKGLFITLMVLGHVTLIIGLGVLYFYMTFLSGERDQAERLAFYKRDDCCITVTATMTIEEHNEYNNYFAQLQFDEQISDFKFVDDFIIISSNMEELQKNGFDFSTSDKRYVFTVGRHSMNYDTHTFPIVAIREVEEGGKVYLDYEAGKSNLLSYLSSKK